MTAKRKSRLARRKAASGQFDALPESAQKTARRALSSRDEARQFLIRTGIVTESGELTKDYR